MASPANLVDLPLDALVCILCFLKSPRDVLNCRQASRCFETVHNAHTVWRALLAQRFDVHIKVREMQQTGDELYFYAMPDPLAGLRQMLWLGFTPSADSAGAQT